MIKLIIVDDELSIQRSMAAAVSWGDLGFELCGTAGDGNSALELTAEYHPELVITDVKMPKMDGITLSRIIREQWPDTEVIIISGYDDFEYARSAICHGVSEYLLKPTDIDLLEEALRKVRQRIDKRHKFKTDYEELREELQRTMPLMRSQMLADISNGNVPFTEEVRERLMKQGFGLSFQPYSLCRFDITDIAEITGVGEDTEYRYWVQRQFRDMAEYHLRHVCPTEFFMAQDMLYVIAELSGNEDDFLQNLGDSCMQIIQEFKQSFSATVYVGISKIYENYSFMNAAKRDCTIALEYRYSRDAGPCILFDEINRFSSVDTFLFDQGLLDDIVLQIRLLNAAAASERFNRLCRSMAAKNMIYSQLYSIALQILLELYNLSIEAGNSPEAVWDAIANLHHCNSHETIRGFVVKTLENVIGDIGRNIQEKDTRIVREIEQFIKSNLSKELSLNEIAQYTHFSKNYLCALFKRETGDTLVKYITRERISKAKQLLKRSEIKITEVSEKVGFDDYFYFAQVFKKYVGVTMSEYREAYMSNENS